MSATLLSLIAVGHTVLLLSATKPLEKEQ